MISYFVFQAMTDISANNYVITPCSFEISPPPGTLGETAYEDTVSLSSSVVLPDQEILVPADVEGVGGIFGLGIGNSIVTELLDQVRFYYY